MCKWLTVRATTDEGDAHPDCPEVVEFGLGEEFTPTRPTCTCYIGDRDGEGKVLRQTFCYECLQPFLEKVHWGNIIIEIR